MGAQASDTPRMPGAERSRGPRALFNAPRARPCGATTGQAGAGAPPTLAAATGASVAGPQ